MAVNERPYDVTASGALLNYNNTTNLFEIGNTHTSIGLPFLYENQVVGKACYGINT
jgi:hypothetical protein